MRLFSVLIYGVTTWCVITSRFVNGSIYLSSIKLEHIMADIENFLRGDCFQKRLFRGQKNFYLSKGTFRSVSSYASFTVGCLFCLLRYQSVDKIEFCEFLFEFFVTHTSGLL